MYKVLIVEDDPMVAMIHEQYLERHGKFTVVGKCRDGWSALEFLMETAVDLVILDVFMPMMDGFETLREIRSRKLGVDVIMVTAANDREALEEALHAGIIDYLIKPFTVERFCIALEKFIVQRKALNEPGTLNQKSIDHIIENVRNTSVTSYPKGIQEITLQKVMDYLRINSNIRMTGDEIAEEVGLTAVTVRRYMNYLAECGKVTAEIDYETGGRPCMRYMLSSG